MPPHLRGRLCRGGEAAFGARDGCGDGGEREHGGARLEWLQQNEVVQVRRGMGNFVAEGARERITQLQRDEFFHGYLPDLFRRMQLLDIPMQRVVEEYGHFKEASEND